MSFIETQVCFRMNQRIKVIIKYTSNYVRSEGIPDVQDSVHQNYNKILKLIKATHLIALLCNQIINNGQQGFDEKLIIN